MNMYLVYVEIPKCFFDINFHKVRINYEKTNIFRFEYWP